MILGDNAGEIAFDTVLVEQLRRRYPALAVSYCVRGENTLNDATREDAAYVGMDAWSPFWTTGPPFPAPSPASWARRSRTPWTAPT